METTTKGTPELGKPTAGTQGTDQGSTMNRGAEIIDQAKQAVTDAYEKTSKTATATYQQALDYGREKPGTLTMIAFGAGVGLGLLLASSVTSRSRTSRIVPPATDALAKILKELFR